MPEKLVEALENFKLPLALSLVGIILILGGIFVSGINQQKPKDSSKSFPKESLVDSQKLISVDVSGAVQNAGVYQLPDGSRIEEAIKAAGGFSQTANGEYISKYLNMAQKLADGTKVYVPFVGENAEPLAQSGAVAGSNTNSKVNINTSTQQDLEALAGIGPVSASKIISDRPYQSVEDLLNKKTISKAVFEKIKDQLVVY